jgi:hypothetical protein
MKINIQLNYDFPKNTSAVYQNEECHCTINKSDFVSTNSDSEKVPLIDKFTTQIVYKPGKCIFWFKIFHFGLTLILLFLITFNSLGQTTITQWNFNGANASSIPGTTSSPAPSLGNGTASLIGATTATIATGTDGPCNETNGSCAWNTTSYPAQSTNNGTAGVQFAVSTIGFQNIQLTFDHRASGTASRWARVDYSLDGGSYWTTNFWNNNGGLPPQEFYSFKVDFSSVSGANNNANFMVRIVSIFSPNAFNQNSSLSYLVNTAYMRANDDAKYIPSSGVGNGNYTPGNLGGTWRFDNVTLSGCSCSTPTTLSFITQPNSVFQNLPMNPSVQVAATCSNGTISTCYNGTVTLTVNSPGCGYTPQTVTFVNGVATFSDIKFLRSPQNNLTFTATSSDLTSATSNTFNVNDPTGAPIVTTLAQNNFDTNTNWIYTIGPDVNYGGQGSGSPPATRGVGVVNVYNYSGNNVLRKSYSLNNTSGEFGCSNTITFSNVPSLSSYNIVDFSFNLLSFGIGCGDGCGVETDEEFVMQVSTNGGTNWNTILTKKGFNNCLFDIASSPVTSLSIGSSPVYTTGSCDTKSAFTLSMTGISQFQFRFTANNNRTEENWAIDNIKLTGTTYGFGIPFNLPTVNLGSDLNFCSSNSQELSASVSSFQPDLSYSWAPSIGLSASNISNPVVSELSAAQTYTLTVTDGHGCIASDQVVVTPKFVKLSPIAFD